MGLFSGAKNLFGKIRDTGSKVLHGARDINQKFGGLISTAATGLLNVPHPVAKAIGGGILAVQKFLGKSDEQLKNEVKDKINEKLPFIKDLMPKNHVLGFKPTQSYLNPPPVVKILGKT